MADGIIAVYAGRGSSHSWTWLADLFESRGLTSARFLDGPHFIGSLEAEPSLAVISGGDGFAMASSLSGGGFSQLSSYIGRGGVYLGICAGAYLPLHSSVAPFSEFNLSSTRIENIERAPGPLDEVPPRMAVRYGTCAIVHPVRGEVELDAGPDPLLAPIYGGPVFREPSVDEVILRYRSFTDRTEFQLAEPLASRMMLGKAAGVSARQGRGRMLLLGPHLEHPGYPRANAHLLGLLGIRSDRRSPGPTVAIEAEKLRRAVADLKVAIVGLENRSFVVGKKLWDGSRYLELVDAIEKRLCTAGPGLADHLSSHLLEVRERLLQMKCGIETDADETTGLLVETARKCVDNHFQVLAGKRWVYTAPA